MRFSTPSSILKDKSVTSVTVEKFTKWVLFNTTEDLQGLKSSVQNGLNLERYLQHYGLQVQLSSLLELRTIFLTIYTCELTYGSRGEEY